MKQVDDKSTDPACPRETAGYVCGCFPSHCENFDEHGLCWCEPDIIEIDGNKIFVHREEQ